MATVVTKLKVDSQQYDAKLKAAKSSLDKFGQSGKGAFSEMSRALGVNITKFAGWGAAVAASAKVAGDSLKQNEMIFDAWGTVVEQSKGIYQGFLDSLNSGNFSGFLTKMNSIVNAAKEAYAALDELGTFNAFNQINKERARTNFTQTIADYKTGAATKEEAVAAGEALKKEMQSQAELERKAYEAKVRELASTRGVDADLLMKALSGDYGSYTDLKALPLTGRETKVRNSGMYGGTYSYEVEVAANEQEKLGQALRKLNDTELNDIQALGLQAQRTATEIANVDRQMARMLGGNKTTTGTTTVTDKAAMEEFFMSVAQSQGFDIINGRGRDIPLADRYAGKVAVRPDLPDEEEVEDVRKPKQYEGPYMTGIEMMGNLQGAIGAIAGSLENIGIEIPEGFDKALSVMDSVLTILEAINTIMIVIETIQKMVAAKQFIPFFSLLHTGGAIHAAGGAVVPGALNAGRDTVPAILSPGETVLNAAQTENVARRLNGMSGPVVTVTGRISGHDILIANDNYNRSQGGSRGTYARVK